MSVKNTHLILRTGAGALADYKRAAEGVGEPLSQFVRAAVALRAWQLGQGGECAAVRFEDGGVVRARREAVKCARPVGHEGLHVSAGASGGVVTW